MFFAHLQNVTMVSWEPAFMGHPIKESISLSVWHVLNVKKMINRWSLCSLKTPFLRTKLASLKKGASLKKRFHRFTHYKQLHDLFKIAVSTPFRNSLQFSIFKNASPSPKNIYIYQNQNVSIFSIFMVISKNFRQEIHGPLGSGSTGAQDSWQSTGHSQEDWSGW